MSKITSYPDKYTARWWHMRVQGTVLALVVLIIPNTPRADVGLLALLLASSVFYFFAARMGRDVIAAFRKERWLSAALLAFSLYLPLNALWAPDPPAALNKAGTFILLFLFTILFAAIIRRQANGEIARIGKVIIWVSAAGIGLACFEILAGHPIREAIYTNWPFTRPSDNAITVFATKNGEIVRLVESEFRSYQEKVRIALDSSVGNRNATVIMLLAWPLLLLAVKQSGLFARRAAAMAIGGTSVLSIVFSYSQTAQAALILSAAVFMAASFFPRLTHRIVVGAWCIATIFAVPLAATPYEMGLSTADWMFGSARDRIAIWNYTARQVPKAPVFGAGIRSTRIINKELQQKMINDPGDTTLQLRLGQHSHNHFLQIWYELGAVGAALFLFAGLALLRKIGALAQSVRPYALAGFVALSVIAAFGYGLWQTWLLSAYTLLVVFMSLAIEFTRRQGASRQQTTGGTAG